VYDHTRGVYGANYIVHDRTRLFKGLVAGFSQSFDSRAWSGHWGCPNACLTPVFYVRKDMLIEHFLF